MQYSRELYQVYGARVRYALGTLEINMIARNPWNTKPIPQNHRLLTIYIHPLFYTDESNQTKRTNPLKERIFKVPQAMQSQRPVTPEPIIVPTKPISHATKPTTTNFTSHQETNKAAQAAIHSRIHNLPNIETVKEKIGKKNKGLMWPTSHALEHPAAPLLQSYATQGCPVDCGPDWSTDQIIAALSYGAHPSAKIPAALKCLLEETKGKVDKGFARITTWKELKKNIPPKFKLSPAAMIPHKSREFRCILDLSFHIRAIHENFKSVNDTTTKLALEETMNQLGAALKRIIAQVADNQLQGKEMVFAKLDIKDGFWRLVVSDDDAWNFCYVLPNEDPSQPLDDTKIVVPNSLQMGWCESPPFFCAASETARDVIASLIGTPLPPHPFEERMLPKNFASLPLKDLTSTVSLLEVFVDDFIGCTDNISRDHLLNFTRAMLHGVHSIFPPPSITGHNGGDPISEKKLDQLDGLWANVKEILGWIIDGANFTIYLPEKKVLKIQKTLKDLSKKKAVRLLEFQKIAGTLHHASMGIPGGRGLFTAIWTAMAKNTNGWIKLTKDLKSILNDFLWLFRDIANKPINVAQLVPTLPTLHGYSDACKRGAGGAWVIPKGDGSNRYIFWTVPFTPSIINLMESGNLSINDLEMAGVLLEWLALEHLLPSLTFIQAGIQCDNTSTVRWSTKFTARSLKAGHLLRALALRQQMCKASPLLVISIAGKLNDMADVASRYATEPAMQKISPTLLSYFNTKFKQNTSWEEFHFPPKLISRVMSSLQGTQLTLESWRRLPGLVKNIGTNGVITQQESKSTRYSKQQIPSSETSSSQHSLQGSGQVTTAMDIKSKFKESLKRLRPSARPSKWLDKKNQSIEAQTHTTSK